MVLASMRISLPLTGLRPARALRLRGRKVPNPTTVTRLPLATLVTIASNTALTASPAAALLTLPAFAATSTRSDFVTTCGMRSPRCGSSYPNRNRKTTPLAGGARDFLARRLQTFIIAGEEEGNHGSEPTACARCTRRLRAHHAGARADHAHLLELGAADAPSHRLAGELGRRGR